MHGTLMNVVLSIHMHKNVIFSMQNDASFLSSQHAFYMNKLFTMIASPCHCPSWLKEKKQLFIL